MGLSPLIEVIAGAAMIIVAVDAFRHSHRARTALLATLPAILALLALTSALVAWSLKGVEPPAFGQAVTVIFLVVWFVVLPVYLPVAIVALEPNGWRRGALAVLLGLGLYASFTYAIYLAAGVWSVTSYPSVIDVTVGHADVTTNAMFLAATCGPLLLSGDRRLALWGCVNVVAVGILAAMSVQGLSSLWCLWAVATCVFVDWYLRDLEKRDGRGQVWSVP